MTISMNMVPEETIEECKRHVDECAALLERTSVPEYHEAIIAHGQSMDENRGASEDQSKSLTATRQQIVFVTKLVLEVNRSAACEGVEQPACIKSSDPQWSLQHRGQSAPPAATSREPDVRSRLGALQR
jgi:hypothetical protein